VKINILIVASALLILCPLFADFTHFQKDETFAQNNPQRTVTTSLLLEVVFEDSNGALIDGVEANAYAGWMGVEIPLLSSSTSLQHWWYIEIDMPLRIEANAEGYAPLSALPILLKDGPSLPLSNMPKSNFDQQIDDDCATNLTFVVCRIELITLTDLVTLTTDANAEIDAWLSNGNSLSSTFADENGSANFYVPANSTGWLQITGINGSSIMLWSSGEHIHHVPESDLLLRVLHPFNTSDAKFYSALLIHKPSGIHSYFDVFRNPAQTIPFPLIGTWWIYPSDNYSRLLGDGILLDHNSGSLEVNASDLNSNRANSSVLSQSISFFDQPASEDQWNGSTTAYFSGGMWDELPILPPVFGGLPAQIDFFFGNFDHNLNASEIARFNTWTQYLGISSKDPILPCCIIDREQRPLTESLSKIQHNISIVSDTQNWSEIRWNISFSGNISWDLSSTSLHILEVTAPNYFGRSIFNLELGPNHTLDASLIGQNLIWNAGSLQLNLETGHSKTLQILRNQAPVPQGAIDGRTSGPIRLTGDLQLNLTGINDAHSATVVCSWRLRSVGENENWSIDIASKNAIFSPKSHGLSPETNLSARLNCIDDQGLEGAWVGYYSLDGNPPTIHSIDIAMLPTQDDMSTRILDSNASQFEIRPSRVLTARVQANDDQTPLPTVIWTSNKSTGWTRTGPVTEVTFVHDSHVNGWDDPFPSRHEAKNPTTWSFSVRIEDEAGYSVERSWKIIVGDAAAPVIDHLLVDEGNDGVYSLDENLYLSLNDSFDDFDAIANLTWTIDLDGCYLDTNGSWSEGYYLIRNWEYIRYLSLGNSSSWKNDECLSPHTDQPSGSGVRILHIYASDSNSFTSSRNIPIEIQPPLEADYYIHSLNVTDVEGHSFVELDLVNYGRSLGRITVCIGDLCAPSFDGDGASPWGLGEVSWNHTFSSNVSTGDVVITIDDSFSSNRTATLTAPFGKALDSPSTSVITWANLFALIAVITLVAGFSIVVRKGSDR